MANYRNLKELLDDHIYAPPEKTINCIKTLFSSLGKEYRRGLISEDEFLIATYYGAYISTVNPDNLSLPVLRDITIKRKALQNNSDFKNSWAEWKRTGRITVQPWMLLY